MLALLAGFSIAGGVGQSASPVGRWSCAPDPAPRVGTWSRVLVLRSDGRWTAGKPGLGGERRWVEVHGQVKLVQGGQVVETFHWTPAARGVGAVLLSRVRQVPQIVCRPLLQH